MQFRELIALCVVFCCAPAIAADASLEGKWKFTSDIGGALKERVCSFEEKDASFSGVCKDDSGSVPVAGTVNGNDVTLTYEVDAFAQRMKLVCSAKRSGSSVKGTLTLGPLTGTCHLAPEAALKISASADKKCRAYLGRTFEGATVTKADVSPATDITAETCVLRAEMPKDLDFEVRMPTRWNGRTVFIGGGGFDGDIGKRFISAGTVTTDPEAPAYATIATNHGHNASATPGATFAQDVQMLAEYAYLAVPRVLAPARTILRTQYGRSFDDSKIVYEGCSGGGRQALIQAQRFPDLFDGIVSRAPASSFVPQFLWYAKLAKLRSAPGAALTPGKIDAIGAAVRAKCDGLDGLQDGIITRQDLCEFDPAELACGDKETDTCLTPPQVAHARGYYDPTNVADGHFTWPGFMPGGESATAWLSFHGDGFEGFTRYAVAQDPDVDPLTVDPEKYLARLDYLSKMIDASNPDLRRFKESGGKLILWTGQADWLITARNLDAYYQSVVEAAGGQTAADEFVEYYTSPDVQHCGGGPGPDQVDLVTPMFEWLEEGTKPSARTIVATSLTAPKPLSRPLCRFPRYPKYVGGDQGSAESFTCAMPE